MFLERGDGGFSAEEGVLVGGSRSDVDGFEVYKVVLLFVVRVGVASDDRNWGVVVARCLDCIRGGGGRASFGGLCLVLVLFLMNLLGSNCLQGLFGTIRFCEQSPLRLLAANYFL